MTQSTMPTMSETVDVDVDPMTAFTVFTDEFEQWWGNGPIDAWDSSRVVSRRIEPGVGGRQIGGPVPERADQRQPGSSSSTPTTPSSSGGSPCGSRALVWRGPARSTT